MICFLWSASVRSATQRRKFLGLQADAPWNEIEPSAFLVEREKGYAALLLPSQLRRSHRAGRRRRRIAEPVGRPRGGVGSHPRPDQSRGRGQSAALGELVLAGGGPRGRIPAYAHRPSCPRGRDAGYPRPSRRTARVGANPASHDGRHQRTTLTLTASQTSCGGILSPHLVVVPGG